MTLRKKAPGRILLNIATHQTHDDSRDQASVGKNSPTSWLRPAQAASLAGPRASRSILPESANRNRAQLCSASAQHGSLTGRCISGLTVRFYARVAGGALAQAPVTDGRRSAVGGWATTPQADKPPLRGSYGAHRQFGDAPLMGTGRFPALTHRPASLPTTLPNLNRVHIKTYGCPPSPSLRRTRSSVSAPVA